MAQVTSGIVKSNTLYYSTFYVSWSRKSYSSANNQSVIDWEAGLITSNGVYWETNAVKINSVVINGTTVLSGKTYSNISGNGTHPLASGSVTINHNSNGTKSFGVSISGWLYDTGSPSGSGTFELPTIPRYATVSHSLKEKAETFITMKWSSDSTIDYIWYSKDNGSTWTGKDVTDGTSGAYTITGLKANTTYNIKTRVRRKDSQLTTDSSALSVTTYKYPTQEVIEKSETSITLSWSCDSTVDYIHYTTDNGTTWKGINVTDGKSGTYTISGLSEYTTYKIKTRVRRKESGFTADTSALSITTYKYPTLGLKSKTETTIAINWECDSQVDYVWYSKDNGSTWTGKAVTNVKNGSFSLSGFTAKTTYKIKVRVKRTATQNKSDSKALSVTTYAYPTQSFKSKTETTITMNWSCDSTVDVIRYSTDNGSTWVEKDVTDGTSGSYTISGLTAKKQYKIKTEVRRKATQTRSGTSALEVVTYNYPYCMDMPDFTIGDRLIVGIYNPLGRKFLLEAVGNDGTVQRVGEYNGTTVSGFLNETWVNFWYSTIKTSQSGKYKMRVTYGSSVIQMEGGTYKVKGTETPTVGTITYADTDTTVTAITGNNQHIVQNKSNLKVTYTSASAKNSATISKYTFELNGVKKESTSAGGTIDFGKVNSAKNLTLTMTVTDSRGLTAKATKTITFLAYGNPTAKVTLNRLNNYEDTTYLTVDGSVSSVNSKNTMAIKYRYKVSGGSYGSYTTISDNAKQTLTLSKDNSYIFNVVVTDAFGSTYNKEHTLGKGVFPLFINTEKNSVGVNSFPADGEAFRVEGGVGNFVDGLKVLGKNMYYTVGDTFSVGNLAMMNGYLTTSSTHLYMQLPLSKPVDITKVKGATVTNFVATIRGVGGYLGSVETDFVATASAIKCFPYENGLTIRVTVSTAYPIELNNTPIAVSIMSLALNFTA